MKLRTGWIHVLYALLVVLASVTFSGTFSGVRAEEKPPEKLVFESKMGNVTFEHAKHVEREKAECETCHDKLFPQSREPLNYKAGMHKPAEAEKTSCAHCHVADGKSFEAKGNCKTCHVKE